MLRNRNVQLSLAAALALVLAIVAALALTRGNEYAHVVSIEKTAAYQLGYLAARDLVFVGDVNRDFKPWLVTSARLYEAMTTLDSESGMKRGLIVIRVAPPSP